MSFTNTMWELYYASSDHEDHTVAELDDGLSLDQKLALVDRTPFLPYFKEIRDGQLISPKFKQASQLLISNCFSLRNRCFAVSLVASVLWPCHFQYRQTVRTPREFFFMVSFYSFNLLNLCVLLAYADKFQDAPCRELVALVILGEEDEKTGTAPTISLTQGHKKHIFPLCSIFGLFQLFDAMLDSELAFMQRQPGPSTTNRIFQVKPDPRPVYILNRINAHKDRQAAIKRRQDCSRDNTTGRRRKAVSQSSLRIELSPPSSREVASRKAIAPPSLIPRKRKAVEMQNGEPASRKPVKR
ncbi:uncharacterized protein K460DRAFT_178334 [Cucurbitaria berberidis CBS 394.84]|uniref:Uncharacterized protein n=1 Tax=Cucurbitaria berberidis CBS 394.84 TaxID=1168544 RepID=A0A9P4GAL4_9PLEO|nr:uncharacterized protein K460DRAFT_178334 [Cucurbitaria berberidis CBS 394.84]KAF1842070.1 hypothetical protein K460DRAFT_178334 [Cucurbitaria berberidis CBS 394.84]